MPCFHSKMATFGNFHEVFSLIFQKLRNLFFKIEFLGENANFMTAGSNFSKNSEVFEETMF